MEIAYNEYLTTHIKNVQNAAYQFFEQTEGNIMFLPVKPTLMNLVRSHDRSKYEKDEWIPYRDYFYGDDRVSTPVNDKFDFAWNLHQKRNPHHWQYWVLIKDSGEVIAQDIPIEYVLEMLCDWHSFSVKDKLSTAKVWYEENKEKMILSDKTRSLIDTLLVYFSDPIPEQY